MWLYSLILSEVTATRVGYLSKLSPLMKASESFGMVTNKHGYLQTEVKGTFHLQDPGFANK